MLRVLVAGLLSLAVASCSAFPEAGPSTSDILAEPAGDGAARYLLAPLDEATVALLDRKRPDSLAASFGDRKPPAEPVIGVGDGVVVTVWEAGPGGLFSAPLATDRFSTG